MADLRIDYKGIQSEDTEYGYPMEARDSFHVIVPETVHLGSPERALAAVRNHPSLAEKSAKVSLQFDTDQNILAGNAIQITGVRTRMNAARMQNNFRLEYRGSLTSRDTATDVTGFPLAIEYPAASGDIQVKTLSVDVPLYDISCVGIRDLEKVGITPGKLQGMWLGAVNSDTFDAYEKADIGAGGLICSEVHCVPHYVSDEKSVYRIQFRFIGANDGWRKYIYWRDPATDEPPPGIDPSLWSRLVQLYHEIEFQSRWPFGEEIP